jgi:hypothetical protein
VRYFELDLSIYKRVKKFVSSGWSTEFSSIFLILYLLMEVFPFVFCHPLEPVGPCFEDGYEGFLSNFVQNLGDRASYALPVRDVVFGELSLDITKNQDAGWCVVPAGSRVRSPLNLFA